MKKGILALAVLALTAIPASAQTAAVLCESDGNHRECRLEGVGVATLINQISDANCIEGQTWGYRNGRVWVDRGCRGQFALTSRFVSAPLDTRVVCESENNRLTRCATNTSAGVQLVRRISDSGCAFGRDWGYDRDGVWVTNGCRAEFGVASGRFTAAPLAGTSMVTCESRENRRTHCRTDTGFGVVLRRTLSDTPCIRNSNWGVDNKGIWVTGGCRAEFTVGSNRIVTANMPLAHNVTCESRDGRRSFCRADTTAGVILARRLSDSSCVYNRSWGFDQTGIWVAGGCRAEFITGDSPVLLGGMISSAPAVTPTLICESENNGHKHCRADTRFGVTLVRRLSDARCERDRTWGVDALGVWVTNGCRAEFVLDRR